MLGTLSDVYVKHMTMMAGLISMVVFLLCSTFYVKKNCLLHFCTYLFCTYYYQNIFGLNVVMFFLEKVVC